MAKLNDFMHSRANITALRLVDMEHHIADDLLRGQGSPVVKVSFQSSSLENQIDLGLLSYSFPLSFNPAFDGISGELMIFSIAEKRTKSASCKEDQRNS